ncbi:MAG: hypothetical protein WCY89_02725 [Flavobacteriaceae bacterium]
MVTKQFFFSCISILFLISCNKKVSQENQETELIVVESEYISKEDLHNYIKKAETVIPDTNTGKPFDTLDYDKVIAYDYKGFGGEIISVIENGEFVDVVMKQKFLDQKQLNHFLQILTKNETYGDVTAFCFDPHLGVVFFKNDKVIYKIDVCLDCNYLKSDTEIPAMYSKVVNKGAGEEFLIPMVGFSEQGKNDIIDFCKELEFTYGERKSNLE